MTWKGIDKYSEGGKISLSAVHELSKMQSHHTSKTLKKPFVGQALPAQYLDLGKNLSSIYLKLRVP